MTTELRESLQRIVDHFLPDEEQHYEQNHHPENHIVHDLRNLQEFLTPPRAIEAKLTDERS